jgi:hypothetical protein
MCVSLSSSGKVGKKSEVISEERNRWPGQSSSGIYFYSIYCFVSFEVCITYSKMQFSRKTKQSRKNHPFISQF